MNGKPLISFYVITCNQEKFIAEAVAGAMKQTWTPLEIVLSDDFSDDATFEIMKKMAKEYKGPHSIILNRNIKRLGVGAHINRIIDLCSGEWIVASAGDDVSTPDRTEKLYNHWLLQGEKRGLVYSNMIEINEDGSRFYERDFRNEVPGGFEGVENLSWNWHERLLNKIPPVHGASFGYPRQIFSEFGPLRIGVVFEDNVLNWRAEMCGKVSLCPNYLVRHRNHSKQLTNIYSPEALSDVNNRRKMLKWSNIATLFQNLEDTKFAFGKGWISKDIFSKAEKLFTDRLRKQKLEYDLFWKSLFFRYFILFNNFKMLTEYKTSQILFIMLPRPIYIKILQIKLKVKSLMFKAVF